MEAKKQSIVTEKDLKLVWRIVKSNWYIPFLIIPLFYMIGRFNAYRLTDIYQATTQILLNQNQVYYQNNVLTDANFYGNASYVDNSNEIRVLQSYDIMKETVRRLKDQLQISYLIEGRVLTTEQFRGMTFNIKVYNINPGWYEVPMYFKVVDYDNYEISYFDGQKKITKSGQFNKELIDVDFGNLLVSRATTFNRSTLPTIRTLNYQFIIHSMDYLIGKFQSNMVIDNPDYTNILTIKMNDIIPERAVLVLDTLNQVYAENSLKAKYELNEKTLLYIDRQLEEIADTLKIVEDTMQFYKQRKNILDLSWEQGNYFGKFSDYENQKSQIKLEIGALDDLEKYIIEDKDPQFLPPSIFIVEKSGFMVQAVNELYLKQLELNKTYNTAKENYPGVGELKSTIKKLKQDLLVYINNARKASYKIIENVDTEIAHYIANIKTLPAKQRGLVNIQRRVTVSEQLYNFLLEKKANTRIAKASIVPHVKVIEAPRSMGAVGDEKIRVQRSYLTIGLFVAMGIILLRAFFFSKIKDVDHLKELTYLPVIGVLPQQKDLKEREIPVDEQPNSKIAEAFRNFRTNLQYANINAQSRTFLVTSFAPGEGKTFTSINLGTTLAKTGKKVVLLELDLHKPRIYRTMGVNPQIGISTYLINQNSFEDIVSNTNIENLFCIYAGPIPPNPSELILTEKIKELIETCKNKFDYIIIDTPPAGLLSDSLYLMQFVDASIFVLNTKSATKKTVGFVQELVEENNMQNMYFLLNGVRRINSKYYYKGYGYSYGYGYGYGGYNYGGYGYGNYGKGSYSKKSGYGPSRSYKKSS